jgi:hypothetical protein
MGRINPSKQGDTQRVKVALKPKVEKEEEKPPQRKGGIAYLVGVLLILIASLLYYFRSDIGFGTNDIGENVNSENKIDTLNEEVIDSIAEVNQVPEIENPVEEEELVESNEEVEPKETNLGVVTDNTIESEKPKIDLPEPSSKTTNEALKQLIDLNKTSSLTKDGKRAHARALGDYFNGFFVQVVVKGSKTTINEPVPFDEYIILMAARKKQYGIEAVQDMTTENTIYVYEFKK